jgi:metal-sulfur cluster biosynthetic enzyme
MSDENPKVLWEADSTHPKIAETLRNALSEVLDPEIGMNIIELGLVRQATLSDNHLHLTMILTTPFCPYGPAMLDSARTKAEETIGQPTTIELGSEMWDPSMMEDSTMAEWGLF